MDSLSKLLVVGLLTPTLRLLSTTFKSGRMSDFRMVLIIPRIIFSHLKQSMFFPRPRHGLLDSVTLFSSIQTTIKFGPTAASKVSHLLVCPSHSTDFPTRFQGIISPSCVLFFVPSHPEEPNILLVQIYFSCMLSVSILYLSCLQLAKDNRTRRVRIQSHQLGCIF